MGADKAKYLRGFRVFSSLSDAELKRIEPRVLIKEFRKNEVVLREEDTNEYMYVVVKGKAKVFHYSEDGRETILALHGEGESFGEISVIDGKTMPATVAATEDSVVALISRRDFRAILANQEKVLEAVLQTFCARLRDSWKRIQMLNFKNAAQRLKTLLVMMSEENGSPNAEGITVEHRLTHQNMADMTGLTRETVTRVLDKWLRDGEITVDAERRIMLRNDFLEKNYDL